jgi:diacylglycerol kinase family enzyme
MEPLQDLKSLRVGALLNTESGGCDLKAQRALEEILRASGIDPVRVWCGGGADVERSVEEAMNSSLDLLVILGGDGTIRSAAQGCGPEGPLLAPLPGGTMNMLPKTLYGRRTWPEALRDTLAAPMVQEVHGGEVEGHRFFVAAIFGEPTRFAEAREAVREGDLPRAINKGVVAVRRALSSEIEYRFGAGPHSSAEAVAVICPLTSAALADEAEVLEAAAIDLDGPLDAVRLGLAAAFADWRNDPTVERARLVELSLSHTQPIPALLDGERFMLRPQTTIRLVTTAFRALKPAADVESAEEAA